MIEKQTVLDELRKVFVRIGRTPGKELFAKDTGIRETDWMGIYWARWGDAVKEAGLEANELQGRSDRQHLLSCLYQIASEYGRMPTEAEQRLYARQHVGFPNRNTFRANFGDKAQLTRELRNWLLAEKPGDPLLSVLKIEHRQASTDRAAQRDGWVYLLRSGDYFKVGRSEQIERRVKQVATSMPDKVELEHAIRTDDPAGIEAYWHRRFSDRRANGEWFRLCGADVKAFKLRKFQ